MDSVEGTLWTVRFIGKMPFESDQKFLTTQSGYCRIVGTYDAKEVILTVVFIGLRY